MVVTVVVVVVVVVFGSATILATYTIPTTSASSGHVRVMRLVAMMVVVGLP